MKRVILYIVILIAVWFVPVEGANIGNLHPVEVVLVTKEEGRAVLMTDTGDIGKGETAVEALADLKKTTPGTVYLDTAEYLLIGENADALVEELRPYLKTSVKVCEAENEVNLVEAAEYLRVHGTFVQLKDYKQGVNLPQLTIEEKRLKLSKIMLDKRGSIC